MHLIYLVTGLLGFLFLLGFAVTSYFELEKRAAAIALIMATVFGVTWFITGHIYSAATLQIALAFWVLLIAGFGLLAWPFGKPAPLGIDPPSTERYDERHVIFGRMELEPNGCVFIRYEEK